MYNPLIYILIENHCKSFVISRRLKILVGKYLYLYYLSPPTPVILLLQHAYNSKLYWKVNLFPSRATFDRIASLINHLLKPCKNDTIFLSRWVTVFLLRKLKWRYLYLTRCSMTRVGTFRAAEVIRMKYLFKNNCI